ncbi:MAG: PilN domain-containing protein [Candidatus Levybacteria bacterium]|nr:PilN domain-containing protein [Candidatus Levybacteria bacterium]
MSEINLLPQKRYDPAKSRNIFLIFRIISFTLLILLFISSMVIFFIKLQSPLNSLKAEENMIIANIDSMKEKSIRNFIIHDRLLNISKVISQRTSYNVLVNQIVQNTPVSVSINSFSLDKKAVLLTISSSSLSSISTFLDNMVDLTIKKKFFSKITLSSLSLDGRNGKYFLSIEGTLL